MSWREGRGAPTIFSAPLTMRCRVLLQDAAAVPHSDAAGQDALGGSPVEGAYDGGRCSRSSEFAEKVEALLSFAGQ